METARGVPQMGGPGLGASPDEPLDAEAFAQPSGSSTTVGMTPPIRGEITAEQRPFSSPER